MVSLLGSFKNICLVNLKKEGNLMCCDTDETYRLYTKHNSLVTEDKLTA